MVTIILTVIIRNMIMMIFFKFRRWHDNVGMMLMMITTIVEWGLFSQLQQWLAEALNAENVTLGKIACFELAISFCSSTHKCSFYDRQLKKTMPYFLLFNRNMLWLGFVIAKERMAELRWRSNKHTQNKSSLCFCIYICICICLCTCICVCVCVCLLSFKQEAADLMEQ